MQFSTGQLRRITVLEPEVPNLCTVICCFLLDLLAIQHINFRQDILCVCMLFTTDYWGSKVSTTLHLLFH